MTYKIDISKFQKVLESENFVKFHVKAFKRVNGDDVVALFEVMKKLGY